MQISGKIIAALGLFLIAVGASSGAGAANCPAGYGGTNCTGCGPGTYSTNGAPYPGAPAASRCVPTQGGMYTTGPANTYEDQIKCPLGQYGNKLRGSTGCRKCPQGTYTAREGAHAKDPYCKSAPAGHYAPAGWTENAPIPCPAGTYQGATKKSLCIDAPVGYYTKIPSAASKVYACPKGTYTDTVKSLACKPCPAGTYQGATGQAACIDAPAGYYTKIASAATVVYACPKGTYADSVKSLECKSCPAGTYQGDTGKAACIDAPAGHYTNEKTAATAVLKCPIGTYAEGVRNAACTVCAPGSTAATVATGSTAKTQCLYNSPGEYYNYWGRKPAPGTKSNSPHKCKDGKNWKTSQQACK